MLSAVYLWRLLTGLLVFWVNVIFLIFEDKNIFSGVMIIFFPGAIILFHIQWNLLILVIRTRIFLCRRYFHTMDLYRHISPKIISLKAVFQCLLW